MLTSGGLATIAAAGPTFFGYVMTTSGAFFVIHCTGCLLLPPHAPLGVIVARQVEIMEVKPV
jgi:hypothetical protein